LRGARLGHLSGKDYEIYSTKAPLPVKPTAYSIDNVCQAADHNWHGLRCNEKRRKLPL